MRGYADFVPLGAEVQPSYVGGQIRWDVTFRDGRTEEFTFPVRNTPQGSIEPYRGVGEADLSLLKSPVLLGEPQNLLVNALPTPKL